MKRIVMVCIMLLLLFSCRGKITELVKKDDGVPEGILKAVEANKKYLEPRRVGRRIEIYLDDSSSFPLPKSFSEIAQWVRPEVRNEITDLSVYNGNEIKDFEEPIPNFV